MKKQINEFCNSLISKMFGDFIFQNLDEEFGYYGLCSERVNIGVNLFDDYDGQGPKIEVTYFDNEAEHEFSGELIKYEYPETAEDLEVFKNYYLNLLERIVAQWNWEDFESEEEF